MKRYRIVDVRRPSAAITSRPDRSVSEAMPESRVFPGASAFYLAPRTRLAALKISGQPIVFWAPKNRAWHQREADDRKLVNNKARGVR